MVFGQATGFLGAMATAAGHNMIHFKEPVHKFVGSLPYIQAFNAHYHNEHNLGHHKYVSTREDPCYSPVGRNIYYATIHTFIGTHFTTYNREANRIFNKSDDISYPRMMLQNIMVHYVIMDIILCAAIYKYLGAYALGFQLWHAAVVNIFAESGNYTDHYGLERRKDEQGVYESIGYQHSWNCTSSPFFFRIQRHSDHHMHGYRPYQIVRKYHTAPTLPYSYVQSHWLIFIPPVWFYIMDPRVKSLRDAQEGIPNDDQWNEAQPKSEADKRRDQVGSAYFVFIHIILTFSMLTQFAGVKILPE